jgi:hypothetical protein
MQSLLQGSFVSDPWARVGSGRSVSSLVGGDALFGKFFFFGSEVVS